MPKATSHRRSSKDGSRSRSESRPRTLPGQIAVCVAPSAGQQVRSTLASLGTIEPYEPARLLILHPDADARHTEITRLLEDLQRERLVEYVTPVLYDPRTGTRQILTDEITVRLKPEAPQKDTLSDMRDAEGVSVASRNEFVPTQYTLRVSQASGTRTIEVAKRLQKREDVEFAAPNYIVDIKR